MGGLDFELPRLGVFRGEVEAAQGKGWPCVRFRLHSSNLDLCPAFDGSQAKRYSRRLADSGRVGEDHPESTPERWPPCIT